MELSIKAQLRWSVLFAFFVAVITSDTAFADMPDFYNESGLNVNRDYPALSEYETIDTFTGKLQLHHTDILIRGNGGMDFKLTRSYTSSDDIWSNMWTMHLGRVVGRPLVNICAIGLNVSNLSSPVLELPDGGSQLLSDDDTHTFFISSNLWKATCGLNGNGLVVTSPEGQVYRMDYQGSNNDWYPTLITDRNGNTISVTYNNPNGNGVKISTITTGDGTKLTFNYATDSNGYQYLTSITDGSGSGSHTWQYEYIPGPQVGTYFLSQVTLPDGTVWKYTYNGNNGLTAAGSYQLSGVTNPMGGVSSYTYGWVFLYPATSYPHSTVVNSRAVSGLGTWTYAYTPSSGLGVWDVTTITDPYLKTETYKHFGYNTAAAIGDAWKIGLLMEKRIGTARTESYTWSPMLVSQQNNARNYSWTTKVDTEFYSPVLAGKTITQDGATYTTSYTYPASHYTASYGNPSVITETGPNGGSRATNLTYNVNTAKWVLHTTQNEEVVGGVAISRTFDANNNLRSITRDGTLTQYTYDSQGNIATINYPRNRLYTYTNYFHGIAQTEVQPEAISISRTVDYWGNILTQTNGRGYTTSYTYDGLNRVKSITHPMGNPVSISYPTATSKITTRGALTESVNYNGFGLPTSVTLGGVSRTYSYDALLRKIFESNPGSSVGDRFAYDQLNRVITVTHADDSIQKISFGAGSVTVTDERNNSTIYDYRSYGDPSQKFLMSVTAPVAAANISIARNARDQVISVMQKGLTRIYGYDANFYLASVTNPETGITTYGRDAEGNMISRSVGTSGTTNYTYDLQNRLVRTVYPGIATPVTQTYTKTGKLASVGSSVASKILTYDLNDNLIGENVTIDGITLAASYGYNANDQLSSLTYPYSGSTVTFTPDVLGRPTSVLGYVNNVTYWPSGQINQISYANGTKTTYGQNSRLWPSTFVTQLGVTAPYVNSSYTYDFVGNLTNIADTANPNFGRSFGYDAINRLTGVNGPWGSGTISYDGAGNILSQAYGATSGNYVYDAANKLSSISGTLRSATYAYDSYGDIVSDGNGKSYFYDGVPNLTGFSDNVSGIAITYDYDGLNKRVREVENGVKTYEFYGADGKLLVEYTPSQTNKLEEYFYLGDKRIAQRLSNR